MKRLLPLILCLILNLPLTACSRIQGQIPFTKELPQQLLETDAFSEPLESLDTDLLWMLYGLEDAGLTPEQLTDASGYRSSGATCEELALLTFVDEAAAQTAVNALALYTIAQIRSNENYRPTEIPKLEKVFLERRGTSVLLLVADNYEAAYELLAP